MNELRTQISNECKQRGEILSKLWKAYFKEISNETKVMVSSKNKLINNIIKQVRKMKAIITKKDDKIKELQNNVLSAAYTAERFENVLKYTKELFNIEQERCEKAVELNNKLQSELLFWFPGYEHFRDDNLLKDKLQAWVPDRINSIEDKELTHSEFIYTGDVQRLMKVADLRSSVKSKIEEAQAKVKAIAKDFDFMKTKWEKIEIEFQNSIKENHFKNQKINELIENITVLQAEIQTGLDSKIANLKNSVETQTTEVGGALGLHMNAKDYHKSRISRRRSIYNNMEMNFMSALDNTKMYNDEYLAVSAPSCNNLQI